MNENVSLKTKFIDEYRRLYLEEGEQPGMKLLAENVKMPHPNSTLADLACLSQPTKSVSISEVKIDFRIDKNSNHRFFLLIPNP
jgi:hypothetical protein